MSRPGSGLWQSALTYIAMMTFSGSQVPMDGPHNDDQGRGLPARRWAKTDATQQRILDAAVDVFATSGFNAATMADVVSRSGASIGSIYHHFGGKTELFVAIFDRMASAIEQRIKEASKQAAGETDRRRILALYVRAYLEAVWDHRRVAKLVSAGDRPPEFRNTRRDRLTAAFRTGMAGLEPDSSRRGQLLTRALLALIEESSKMAVACEDPNDLAPIIEATIDWVGRLTE
ncbi:TetR/AcrR family transcriptional regulator [Mycobacterium kansasii]|nr:TetR/AcrR family transcriptional regulator [Mycobacterium kansasii]